MSSKEKIIIEKKEKIKKHKSKEISNNFKKFFYGIGKEFERTSWTTKDKVFSDFIVVVIVVLILAAIFTGISIFMLKFIG